MPEVITPAKVVIVEMECHECFAGMMERVPPDPRHLNRTPSGKLHRCESCGMEERYEISYPTQRTVKDE